MGARPRSRGRPPRPVVEDQVVLERGRDVRAVDEAAPPRSWPRTPRRPNRRRRRSRSAPRGRRAARGDGGPRRKDRPPTRRVPQSPGVSNTARALCSVSVTVRTGGRRARGGTCRGDPRSVAQVRPSAFSCFCQPSCALRPCRSSGPRHQRRRRSSPTRRGSFPTSRRRSPPMSFRARPSPTRSTGMSMASWSPRCRPTRTRSVTPIYSSQPGATSRAGLVRRQRRAGGIRERRCPHRDDRHPGRDNDRVRCYRWSVPTISDLGRRTHAIAVIVSPSPGEGQTIQRVVDGTVVASAHMTAGGTATAFVPIPAGTHRAGGHIRGGKRVRASTTAPRTVVAD